MVFAVTGTIDVVQWAIDFTGVGNAVNEVIDTPIGIIFAIYVQLRGVSLFKRLSRLASLVLGDLAEQFTDSVAPAWVIDAWYIHKTVKEEWAAQQAATAEEEAEEDENAPVNRMVNGVMMRKPVRIQPPNKNGRRSPNGDIRPLRNTPTVAKTQKNEETSLAA